MMLNSEFYENQKRRYVNCERDLPFPVPLASLTGIEVGHDNWNYFTGELVDKNVIVKQTGDMDMLYKMGFFGKGNFSRFGLKYNFCHYQNSRKRKSSDEKFVRIMSKRRYFHHSEWNTHKSNPDFLHQEDNNSSQFYKQNCSFLKPESNIDDNNTPKVNTSIAEENFIDNDVSDIKKDEEEIRKKEDKFWNDPFECSNNACDPWTIVGSNNSHNSRGEVKLNIFSVDADPKKNSNSNGENIKFSDNVGNLSSKTLLKDTSLDSISILSESNDNFVNSSNKDVVDEQTVKIDVISNKTIIFNNEDIVCDTENSVRILNSGPVSKLDNSHSNSCHSSHLDKSSDKDINLISDDILSSPSEMTDRISDTADSVDINMIELMNSKSESPKMDKFQPPKAFRQFSGNVINTESIKFDTPNESSYSTCSLEIPLITISTSSFSNETFCTPSASPLSTLSTPPKTCSSNMDISPCKETMSSINECSSKLSTSSHGESSHQFLNTKLATNEQVSSVSIDTVSKLSSIDKNETFSYSPYKSNCKEELKSIYDSLSVQNCDHSHESIVSDSFSLGCTPLINENPVDMEIPEIRDEELCKDSIQDELIVDPAETHDYDIKSNDKEKSVCRSVGFFSQNNDNEPDLYVMPDSDDSDFEPSDFLRKNHGILKKDPYPLKENLQLSLEEAFFLSYGLGCLVVTNEKKEPLNLTMMWRNFMDLQDNFLSSYIVYHYFRSKGWVPKEGLKFGVDFVVYKEGPPFYHSTFCVIVRLVADHALGSSHFEEQKPLTWKSVMGLNRITESAGKKLMICYVVRPSWMTDEDLLSPKCISQLKVKEVVFNRWISSEAVLKSNTLPSST